MAKSTKAPTKAPGAGIDRKIPFWSTKNAEITTSIGKSKYHLSGVHSQTVSEGELIMDSLSLLGQRLDGADLGAVTLTLKSPLKAKLSSKGSFESNVDFVLTSGGATSTVSGKVTGRLDASRTSFAQLCVSALADTSEFTVANSRVSSQIAVAAA